MKLTFNSNGNLKQKEAIQAWVDPHITDIVYGGAKGSGKSFLGCSLIFGDALMYPDTTYFIARNELNDLRRFTVQSIHEVFNTWNITEAYWKYNGQDNYFELYNGSRVYLLGAKYLPSDPLYQRFGSMQFTRGWIEEAGEFDYNAMVNLNIAVGRWNNKTYNLCPKLLQTCNPSKNYLYKYFYLPWRKGTLEEHKVFIQALPTDNKMLGEPYVEHLRKNLRGSSRERLLNGNWDYDDDPNALCDHQNILALFDNHHVESGEKYITADIARFGSDKAVIGVWDGWQLIQIITFDRSKTTTLQKIIQHVMSIHDISVNNVIADEDGVGGGVVDNLNIQGFKNNARPIKENKEIPNYRNLQTQCLYKLAEKIENRKIWISAELDESVKDEIIEELAQIKADNSDINKLAIISKEQIKKNIGRSPDYRDMLLMRVYFDLKPKKEKLRAAICLSDGTMYRI